MKVLHVVNISFVLPYYIGEQFDFFQNKGVEFYVACTPDPFLSDYCKEKGLTAIPLNIMREINIREDLKAIRKITRIIKQENIDVVIGHTPKGALVAMIAATLAQSRNRVYFRHGLMYETSKGIKRFILKNIERFTGLLASKVICVSPSVLMISNKERLSNCRKNTILNKGTCNGIDALVKFNPSNIFEKELDEIRKKYNIGSHDQVVGYVGRLVNDKGINELVQAWQQIIKTRANAKLLLVGPFENRDALSPALKEYIINEASIIHTGLIGDTALFYSLMNVFILPSYREGFPTVVLEASAMELPVLTTRATGCRDSIINNETGMFVELNPSSIADKIQLYLDKPLLAAQHGKNGRSFVLKNFEQNKIWKEIEEKVFNNTIGI